MSGRSVRVLVGPNNTDAAVIIKYVLYILNTGKRCTAGQTVHLSNDTNRQTHGEMH